MRCQAAGERGYLGERDCREEGESPAWREERGGGEKERYNIIGGERMREGERQRERGGENVE